MQDSPLKPPPVRPNLRDEQKDATRARILAASRACFERRGVAETRFEEIAAEARISRATLYLHFVNKDAVLVALLAEHLTAALGIYAKLQSAEPDAVRAWLQRHVATLRRHRGAMRLFHVAIAVDETVRRLVDRHREEVIALLAGRFAGFDVPGSADPKGRRAAVVLMLARVDHLLSASVADDPPFDVEVAVDLVAAEFAACLAAPR
jgi:AcrR family transcriptional regulator